VTSVVVGGNRSKANPRTARSPRDLLRDAGRSGPPIAGSNSPESSHSDDGEPVAERPYLGVDHVVLCAATVEPLFDRLHKQFGLPVADAILEPIGENFMVDTSSQRALF